MGNPIIQIDDELREMTADEISELNKLRASAQASVDADAAKAAARESALAKLAALGLTEAEIAAL
jgi:DNA-binding NarL/FixJ family response regulator